MEKKKKTEAGNDSSNLTLLSSHARKEPSPLPAEDRREKLDFHDCNFRRLPVYMSDGCRADLKLKFFMKLEREGEKKRTEKYRVYRLYDIGGCKI